MSTLIKWIAAPIVAVGLMAVADTPQAQAQGFSFGTRGLSIQFGQSYPSYYTRAPHSYYRSYNNYRYNNYRYNNYRYDCRSPYRYGHYNYHPTEIIRHGNHYDVIPGHFDYFGPHRSHRHR